MAPIDPTARRPELEAALGALRTSIDGSSAGPDQATQEAFLHVLAESELVVPQPETAGDTGPESVTLPVFEQEEISYVPAFTSTEQLTAAGLDAPSAVTVRAADLGAGWPAESLWLALNPGSDLGAAVPPDAVRALPTLLAAG